MKTALLVCAGLLAGTLFASWDAHADVSVLAVQPPPHSISADNRTELFIAFSKPIDTLTVTSAAVSVFGRWSGPVPASFVWDETKLSLRVVPERPFQSGERVTVALFEGVRSEEGDSLIAGFGWSFWIAARRAILDLALVEQFSMRRPGETHVQSYGAHAGDLNHDGFSDLAIPNEVTHDVRVCLNDGTGRYSGGFTIFLLPSGSSPSANEGADFDRDGHIDLAVGSGGNSTLSILFGDGSGGFGAEVPYQAGLSVRGVATLDLEADGHDDVVTANRSASNLTLFSNLGTGLFAPPVPLEAGGAGETAVAAADANEDGIMDLFVGAYGTSELILLLGDGAGSLTFADKVSAGGRSWMIAAGDVNGDGHVDVVSANSISNNVAVILGDGLGGLSVPTTYPAGQFVLAVDLGDLDGDGDLDMVTSSFTSANFIVFENDGLGTFTNPRSYPASSAGSCATIHDRDNDGDLDLTGIDEVDDLVFLFLNTCPIEFAGDLDSSGTLTSTDILQLVAYIFKGGLEPLPCGAAADVNCSGGVTSADVIYLVNHVFKGGPQPCHPCVCP
jgi:hypothetical protein